MKPGRLYLKIFFSFLAALVVTLVLIMVLFLATTDRYRARFQRYAAAQAMVTAEAVGGLIDRYPDKTLSQNPALDDFLKELAERINGLVWLSSPEGVKLAGSFTGDPPEIIKTEPKKKFMLRSGVMVRHYSWRQMDYYVTMPLTAPHGRKLILNVYSEDADANPAHGLFLPGLLVVGLIIALMVIPVSRLVTRRVDRLRHSALLIADGQLSHRATVKGKDEIAGLARSFNHMTDRLESMIRARQELLANVSHELRSPLTRLEVAVELLRDRLEALGEADVRGRLEDIDEEVHRMDQLIGRILAYCRIDLDQSPFDPQPGDLNRMVEEMAQRYTALLERAGLSLDLRLAPLPHLPLDRDGLETILGNLLDNAAHYTPAGGAVQISTSAAGGMARLVMSNSSDQPPPGDPEGLFEPFRRPAGASGDGAGLGLAIARRIARRHGGDLTATPRPQGRFSLELSLPLAGPGPR